MSTIELVQLPQAYFRHSGDQLDIVFGDVKTEFGLARSAWLEGRLLFLGFYEGDEVSGWDAFTKQLVDAKWRDIDHRATELYQALGQQSNRSVWVCGTAFQRSVWEAISNVPKGKTVSYSDIAFAIKNPKAARAVGSALGANNIAYWIPCHRAVRGDGSLGGYRWGLSLKTRILSAEATHL